MRWLVTGATGMLGRDAVHVLGALGDSVTGLSHDDLDITDERAVSDAVSGHDAVLNCAAWTAVDAAEDEEPEAFRVNAVGPAFLARAARASGSRLVHISTDYVFDGSARLPYPSDGPLRPLSAYGRTKAAGEWAVRAEASNAHLIVRTSWLYGAHGGCFPTTVAASAAEKGVVSVVSDQVGQPTWTVDVARFIHRLVMAGVPAGTYHATSEGQGSWFEFAQEVCESTGLGREVVVPTTSADFPRRAPRPSYSVLDHGAAESVGVVSIGDWRERWRESASAVLATARGSSFSASRSSRY